MQLMLAVTSVILIHLHSFYSAAQESSCCSRVTGTCRNECLQMSLVTIAVNASIRQQKLQYIQSYCPQQLVDFWECLNETLEDIIQGENWSGRSCCSLPQSSRCQLACVTASSRDGLSQNCRQSDELSFFMCLERQESGDKCCSNAKSPNCLQACRAIFRNQMTPSREVRDAVNDECEDHSPKVLQCVKNFTRVTPATNSHKFMYCCDSAKNEECENACRGILRSGTTIQEIVDHLQAKGCGPPMLHDKMWQCFLKGSKSTPTVIEVSTIDKMWIDSAKLHCCTKATSPTCRNMCIKTYSTEWAALSTDFNRNCLSQLSEDSLRQCIDEVEEPCELGCDGLSYCTNFNNRPTELFRSCTRSADDNARFDIMLWQEIWQKEGYLGLPGLELPVRNIAQCSPQSWKAVACALQVKPCHRMSHTNRICREDCRQLLTKCVDWSRMSPDHDISALCARLSPKSPDVPCISLKPFMEPGDNVVYDSPKDGITLPCRDSPCGPSEICEINRNCLPGSSCLPYTCTSGCKVGDASQYKVPVGSYVRIPTKVSTTNTCVKICNCSANGMIEQCQRLPCYKLDSCSLGTGNIAHGKTFRIECKIGSCYAGELIYSKKQCEVSSQSKFNHMFTSFPCNCPRNYKPVCGRNGKTYPSSCLAKCAGLKDSDLQYHPCSSFDPCSSRHCADGYTCIPIRKVCLTLLPSKSCPQYECVPNLKDCSKVPYSHVCDIDGQTHPNICYLLQYGKGLAYKGPCLSHCSNKGVVCGVDGETYASECAAFVAKVSVDYTGPCKTVGLIGEEARRQCDEVSCPPLEYPDCIGVTPPGACCPICGGAVRFLYSQKQVDRALYVLGGNTSNALTVSTILDALERQVQVAECIVQGYLTIESDLFVIVRVAPWQWSSELRRESCVREAEKLANLVRGPSPRILSELSLSALITAVELHGPVTNIAASIINSLYMSALLVLTYVIILR